MLERRKAWSYRYDGRTAPNHRHALDAAHRGVLGLRGKDAARALRAAGQALAGGALARATGRSACVHRRARATAQNARAADLALALPARVTRPLTDEQRHA